MDEKGVLGCCREHAKLCKKFLSGPCASHRMNAELSGAAYPFRRENTFKGRRIYNERPQMETIKTTINVDADLWRDFSIQVIKCEGYRKKNDVIEELIREYVEQRRGEKQNE